MSNYLSVSGGNLVYTSDGNVPVAPPSFLYLNDYLKVNATNICQRWANPNNIGDASVAARDTAGDLIFKNTDYLPINSHGIGNYRLMLDVGNIGALDDEFPGFQVEISFESTAGVVSFTAVLLENGRFLNPPRTTETIDFQITSPLGTPDLLTEWALRIHWTNPRSLPNRGQIRVLGIYGYKIRQTNTLLYSMDYQSGQLVPTPIDVVNGTPPTIPGGWVEELNSNGILVGYVHESLVTSTSDAPGDFVNNSVYPVSNLLTGCTEDRREDILLETDMLLPDDTLPTGPVVTLGTIWYDIVELPGGTFNGTIVNPTPPPVTPPPVVIPTFISFDELQGSFDGLQNSMDQMGVR